MKSQLFNWTRIAGSLLMCGALAWAIKLAVIISTNGRIIDTGVAALMMKVGLITFAIGSTGIGSRLMHNRNFFLRVISVILSPIVVFGSFLLFAAITTPLLKGSSIWYAQQESAIVLVVLVYAPVGYHLYRSADRLKKMTVAA